MLKLTFLVFTIFTRNVAEVDFEADFGPCDRLLQKPY